MGKRRWSLGTALRKYMNEFSVFENNKLTLLPPFDHKEAEDDDCGLPQNPIYANYTKYLWTSHRRSGGVEVVNSKGVPPEARPFP
jgi:hypothetical protein